MGFISSASGLLGAGSTTQAKYKVGDTVAHPALGTHYATVVGVYGSNVSVDVGNAFLMFLESDPDLSHYNPLLGNHVPVPFGIELDNNDFSNAPKATAKPICQHIWKRYTGLIDVFDYCETCDKKKEVKL